FDAAALIALLSSMNRPKTSPRFLYQAPINSLVVGCLVVVCSTEELAGLDCAVFVLSELELPIIPIRQNIANAINTPFKNLCERFLAPFSSILMWQILTQPSSNATAYRLASFRTDRCGMLGST